MRPDPGDIPGRMPGRAELVQALSDAPDLPAEAMDLARLAPGRIAPDVLAALERAASGEELDDPAANLLFWGLHVLAEARDARVFPALMRLLAREPEQVAAALGDAVVTTLPRIAISTFDGDPSALEAVLLEREADEFVRWSLWGALAYLVFEGRVEPSRLRDLAVRFDRERAARAGDAAWTGWAQAIALCGFADLAPAVAAARADARLLEDEDPDWFARTLARAGASPADPERFDELALGPIEDAIEDLAEALAEPDEEAGPLAPTRNLLKDVGRNDPCPCGSGRKFKKCCLEAPR